MMNKTMIFTQNTTTGLCVVLDANPPISSKEARANKIKRGQKAYQTGIAKPIPSAIAQPIARTVKDARAAKIARSAWNK